MKPKLPKGYRLLKVGEKRPKGYMHWAPWKREWAPGAISTDFIGQEITEEDISWYKFYIAPKRPAKRRKKK